MAVIPKLPSRGIIDGFRGTLDFYRYKGQYIVRMWPRKPTRPRVPAVQQGITDFSYMNQLFRDLPPVIVDAYKAMASGTGLTWRDYLIRSYISGIDY